VEDPPDDPPLLGSALLYGHIQYDRRSVHARPRNSDTPSFAALQWRAFMRRRHHRFQASPRSRQAWRISSPNAAPCDIDYWPLTIIPALLKSKKSPPWAMAVGSSPCAPHCCSPSRNKQQGLSGAGKPALAANSALEPFGLKISQAAGRRARHADFGASHIPQVIADGSMSSKLDLLVQCCPGLWRVC
jgi:hypothetical protein